MKKIFSGDYLMKIGLNAFTTSQTHSRVIELVAE
ncbi:GH36 C-terminal domain-containing protein [Bacteroides fragilis]|nr:GH36 C-terminal domain-containing protein [Bacteroides fragilis]